MEATKPRLYFVNKTGFEIGESRVGFFPVKNSAYAVIFETVFQGMGLSEISGQNTAAIYERTYYFLNKSDGSFSQIRSYTDDITGEVQKNTGERLILPEILPVDKTYVLYQPIDLIGKDLPGISDSDFPPSLFNQLREVQQNLDEMDNPVLLIGSVKLNI